MLRIPVITIVLNPFDPEHPTTDRINKVLMNDQEIPCSRVRLNFSASKPDSLELTIHMPRVNIVMAPKEDKYATEADSPTS